SSRRSRPRPRTARRSPASALGGPAAMNALVVSTRAMLREQAARQVVRRALNAARAEEVAAADRTDVVDQRLADQPPLRDHELPLEVLLVAGEDQALIEVA